MHGVQNARSTHFANEEINSYGFDMGSKAAREISRNYSQWGKSAPGANRAAAGAPILHLYAEPDEAGFLAAQQALAREPWFQVQKLGAQSDFPMFEASGDIVRAIEGSWWRSSEMMHRTRFGCPARDVCCRLEHYSSV